MCNNGDLLGLEIAYWMFTRQKKSQNELEFFKFCFSSCFRDESREEMTCFDAFSTQFPTWSEFYHRKVILPFFWSQFLFDEFRPGLGINDVVTLLFFFFLLLVSFFSLREIGSQRQLQSAASFEFQWSFVLTIKFLRLFTGDF